VKVFVVSIALFYAFIFSISSHACCWAIAAGINRFY
jgi:hypothetical protein